MFKRFLKFLPIKKQESYKPVPKSLLNILQFKPNNPTIFQYVFTPRSAQKKSANGASINYERLEFLGDAMLGAVIAKYLFDEAPGEREGYLTQMRSKIVSRKHLNEIGKDLKLIDYIDEDVKKNNSLSQHIEGDIFEALVGAVYEDQGFETTKNFIHRVVIDRYVDIKKLENRISSYKSYLFEWAQKNKIELTFHTNKEVNAEETTIFESYVKLNGVISGKGRGTSKKKAEENAARRVYYSKQKQM
ncbi:MAG: ribonuclease III [Weeksellaceae bacterium]